MRKIYVRIEKNKSQQNVRLTNKIQPHQTQTQNLDLLPLQQNLPHLLQKKSPPNHPQRQPTPLLQLLRQKILDES